jgi:hypothetical protein
MTAAAAGASAADVNVVNNVTGYASLENGQVIGGNFHEAYSIPNAVFVQRMFTGFNVESVFNPLNIKGNIGMEMMVTNDYPRWSNDQGSTRWLYYYPYLTEADLSWFYGNSEKPLLSITAGYFPFKYNNDARNLGEYLFRSGAYPQTLQTNFDFAADRLMGLNIGGNFFEGFSWNIILNTNQLFQAVGDLNLAGLVAYNFHDIFEIGAGAQYTSLISADTNFTHPENGATSYINSSGDTSYFTNAGLKLMARVSFDVKKLFPGNDLFGKEDLKIYSEAAILGVKNYPLSIDKHTEYDTLSQRIPIMFGINLPAFKFLDVFSVQGEWFGNPYPNDMDAEAMFSEPIPFNGTYSDWALHKNLYKTDNWKWSVYAKRTFAGHFSLTAQVACDHFRWYINSWQNEDYQEAFQNPHQFYYVIKCGYAF